MARHLVLAVHGIGEQKPGDTLDAIVGAATTDLVDPSNLDKSKRRQSSGAVDVHRDIVELPEREFDGSPRNAKLFPVHVRRVRRAGWSKTTDDAVFAEVYWADKSPAPQGFFWTAFDLLKVILGLGYIGMDNVENTRTRSSVIIFHAFTWCFYGIIAPLNAVLLIGALLLLMDPTVFQIGDHFATHWILLLQGAITVSTYLLLRFGARSTYLVAIFRRGLLAFGAIILIVWAGFQIEFLAVVGHFISTVYIAFLDLLPGKASALCEARKIPSDLDPKSFKFITGGYRADPGGGLECIVSHTISLLKFFWFVTISLGFLTLVTSWFFPRSMPKPQNGQSDTLYPAIAGAMVMFWMVSTSSFWLLFGRLVSTLSTPGSHHQGADFAAAHAPSGFLYGIFQRQFQEAQDTLGLSIYGLGAFIFAALLLFGFRRWKRESLDDPATAVLLSRVILNPGIKLVLCLFMVSAFLLVMGLAFSTDRLPEIFKGPADFAMHWLAFDPGVNGTIAAIALGLGILIYNFPSVVSGGLGVLRDIVTYAVQSACICKISNEEYRNNFPLRVQINNRFERVLQHCLLTTTPKHVTIICHSQGTVVATQMLQSKRVHDLLGQSKLTSITLITMGSPVTQVYRHYFPRAFKVFKRRMPDKIKWYNIYRSDDYVGTMISADTGVDANLGVRSAGHTGYFTDHDVWKRLWNDVEFRMF